MKALSEAGLPVPRAMEVNRHAVLMSLINGHPLVQVKRLGNPRRVYEGCMDVLVKLAGLGLVHCDYNEFNILVSCRVPGIFLLMDYACIIHSIVQIVL